jgi:hypothetical protein
VKWVDWCGHPREAIPLRAEGGWSQLVPVLAGRRRTMKNRKLMALVLSGVFPGLGQLYNRQWIKGAAYVFVGLLLSWRISQALPHNLDTLPLIPLDRGTLATVGLLLAIWLLSAIDAWRRA